MMLMKLRMKSSMNNKLKSYLCLLVLFIVLASAFAQHKYAPYPEPENNYVTDLADIITAEDEAALLKKLQDVEDKTKVEIVVVTIKSLKDYPKTNNDSIESFANGLFNTYEIGNLPKNDGILLLISKNDRKMRIEFGEYYGHFHDRKASQIIQNTITPFFKEGEYSKGVVMGTEAIINKFTTFQFKYGKPIIAIMVLASLFLITISLVRNGKRGWGWVFAGIFVIVILVVFRVVSEVLKAIFSSGTGNDYHYIPGLRNNTRYRNYWGSSSSSGSYGSSFGGFGGSSGGSGGGGFGGGSSGGGGASGGW